MSDGTFIPRGATAWSSYNTPRIWAMVENEDDPESWRQVAALGSMAGLLKDQRSRLEAAKQKLIDAWPPGENKASAAFVELIDNLLFTMRKNKEIADSNAGALSQTLEALRQAKKDIAPLYQAYLEKSDDWVPAWWDGAEDELDEQARERMREAERIIAHPDNTITSPALYEFTPGRFVSEPIETGIGAATPSGAGAVGAAGGFPVPHDPPPTLPDAGAPVSAAGPPPAPPAPGFAAGGPDLAGVITPAPGPVPGATPPTPPAPTGLSAGPPPVGLVIGGGLSAGLPGSGARGGRGGFAPFGAGPPRAGSGVAGGGRASSPAGKPATPPWLAPASGQPPRGAAGVGARSGGPSAVPVAGGRRPPDDHRDGMTFDPDSPWATATGVPPVIEPSRRHYRHDPGPGVIGWHG